MALSDYFSPNYDDLGYLDFAIQQASRLPVREVVEATTQPDENEGFWDTLNRYAGNTSDWLKRNEPLLKWGIPAVGGIASYLSANEYNKLAEQQRNTLAAEKAARQAEAKKLGAARNFTLARQKAEGPTTRRGEETQFFLQNALSANPSTVEGYAVGGQVQSHFSPEYYSNGKLNFAKGGNVSKKKVSSPLASVTVSRQLVIPSQAELEDKLMQQRAIEQLMMEKADQYRQGIDEQPTDAELRLMDSVPRLGGYANGGYFAGGAPGQSDKIPAMLSDGEFVMDADTVSALGDGNNAAGASALEQMRRNIRAHKRNAPVNKIPPKAKKPEQYMKKGKK